MPDNPTLAPDAAMPNDPTVATASVRPAGVFRRLVAMLIDWTVVSMLYGTFLALGVRGASLGARASGARFLSTDLAETLTGPFILLWLGLAWVYIGWFTRHGGQTPGKMLLGIRIVSIDGSEPSWGQALLRPAGYLISWMPFGLGFVMAVLPPAKRALHDWLTGTRVIRTSAGYGFRSGASLAISAWMLATVVATPPASAALVERILATVNDQLITLSDVTAYQLFTGLPPSPNEEAVRALIDRRLLLNEADRFSIPIPAATDIAARTSAITTRLGGPEALTRTLTRLGWGQSDLKAWVTDELRVTEFLNQRIYFFIIIPPQDVDAYYESHREEFTGLSADEARDLAGKRLVQERGDVKRDQFLAGLRDKAAIRVNPID
jgi:uncharacterized RDD family membrane protein YckC